MSHFSSDLLQESITKQQEEIEEKQTLISNLTDHALDQSVQIDFDKEIINQLNQDIIDLKKLNQHLSEQLAEKDKQNIQMKERINLLSLLHETYQITEVQLKQQIEELNKKIDNQEKISIKQDKQNQKLNLDFSWISHMERDLSHDGLLARYDRYKSQRKLVPIQIIPYSEKFKQNKDNPYFNMSPSDKRQVVIPKKKITNKQ